MKLQKYTLKMLVTTAAVIVAAVAVDLLTKSWAQSALASSSVPVIGNWLVLRFTTNGGSSFSFLEGAAHANVIFFVITLIGLPLLGFLLAYNIRRKNSIFGSVGLMLMMSGALGNAIDRLFLGDGFFNGRVRDFISVRGFATFNVADACLCVGIVMFIIALLFLDDNAVFAKKGKKDE